jgi:hypothetical protein
MPREDESSFRVRPGKRRVREGRGEQLTLSFTKQVTRAIAKQGRGPRGLFLDQGSRNKTSNRCGVSIGLGTRSLAASTPAAGEGGRQPAYPARIHGAHRSVACAFAADGWS